MGRLTTPSVRYHVADLAVARIAARAVRSVPGVAGLRADLQQTLLGLAGDWMSSEPPAPELRTDGVAAVVRDDTAEVLVTVVTRLGYNQRELAAAIRRAVADAVLTTAGLRADVRVTIADIDLG